MMTSSSEISGVNISDEPKKFMEFGLGDEIFAIPLLKVKEVINIPQFTNVPYTPDYFLGIMNLRGQVLSVIDLRKKMNITPKIQENETAIIILDLFRVILGVMVDSINSVKSISASNVAPPPDIESRVSAQYITGIHQTEGRLTLIIDITSLLSLSDLKSINNQARAS